MLDKYLLVLQRLSYLFYWFFDNLNILMRLKFIRGNIKSQETTIRLAYKFWLAACLLGIICAIRTLVVLATEEYNVEKNKDAGDAQAKKKRINQQRVVCWINIARKLGDSLICSQGLNYPSQLLGFQFNDAFVGFGGLASALLSCYLLYPSK
jgi:hypothetical protein